MRKQAHRREQTGNRTIDRLQDETKRIVERGNGCPFFDGVLRSVTLAAATPKTVDHGLGSRATFIVVRHDYAGGVTAKFAEAASQAGLELNNQLSVVADANVTVDLWFYPIASERVPR